MSKLNGIFSKIFSDFIKSKTYRKNEKFSKQVDLVIAVSGAAALGKTFFTENLKDFLESHDLKTTYIGLDGYLFNRQSRKEKNLSGYNPNANDIVKMISDLEALIFDSIDVEVSLYDHKKGDCIGYDKKYPNPIIILDGIMSMHYEIRKLSNLKIFMEADELTLKGLRILEDTNNRGYTIVEALRHAETEYKEYLDCIEQQKSFADVLVSVDHTYQYEYKINKKLE